MKPVAILVIGATGFIGRALVAGLLQEGRTVIALTRNLQRARRLLGSDVQIVRNLADLPDDCRIEAIVNLAGAPVLGMPWTESRRSELLQSRVGPAAAALELMRRLHQKPAVLVAASAVGFYGASSNDSFAPRDESSPPQPGQFQSDLCAAVEQEALKAEGLGVRVVRLRLAVVLGRGGGAYPMLTPSARLGLGAVLGSGRQAAPWIHHADAVALLRFALDHSSLQGPLNAVAPDVRSQADFTRALAASFGRKVFLRLPAAPLRLLAGEMGSLLLDGQNAVPTAALAAGYSFLFPRLDQALQDLADR